MEIQDTKRNYKNWTFYLLWINRLRTTINIDLSVSDKKNVWSKPGWRSGPANDTAPWLVVIMPSTDEYCDWTLAAHIFFHYFSPLANYLCSCSSYILLSNYLCSCSSYIPLADYIYSCSSYFLLAVYFRSCSSYIPLSNYLCSCSSYILLTNYLYSWHWQLTSSLIISLL